MPTDTSPPAHQLRGPADVARDLLRLQIGLERLRRDLFDARAEARTQSIIAGFAIEEAGRERSGQREEGHEDALLGLHDNSCRICKAWRDGFHEGVQRARSQ